MTRHTVGGWATASWPVTAVVVAKVLRDAASTMRDPDNWCNGKMHDGSRSDASGHIAQAAGDQFGLVAGAAYLATDAPAIDLFPESAGYADDPATYSPLDWVNDHKGRAAARRVLMLAAKRVAAGPDGRT